MSQTGQSRQTLSEIGHLFLSEVRQRQGQPAAERRPPGRRPPEPVGGDGGQLKAVDLAEQEVAQVLAGAEASEPVRRASVCAVIAAHLNDKQGWATRQYARHLAWTGQRVGLIELDGGAFRLSCFERRAAGVADTGSAGGADMDAAQMSAAVQELGCDVDAWLIAPANPRGGEARALLRAIDHWTLLSNVDHDGVVACYRTMKGLKDSQQPRVTVALLQCPDDAQAAAVFNKLSGVAQQFLGWAIQRGPCVSADADVAEHLILGCVAGHDQAQSANAPQWQVVGELLAQMKAKPAAAPARATLHPAPIESARVPVQSVPSAAVEMKIVEAAPAQADDGGDEVMEIGDASAAAILGALLRKESGKLLECPIRAPMCAEARLTVDRERRLVLLAVGPAAPQELGNVARAYRWAVENLSLIAMAVPQLAIDTSQEPRLRLIVEHGDATAGALMSLLGNVAVDVQTYRRVKWGAKTGLLLEAA